jgi:hypothetical protein
MHDDSIYVQLTTPEAVTAIACFVKCGADLSEATDLSSREALEVAQTRDLICGLVRKVSTAGNFRRKPDGFMIRETDLAKPSLSPSTWVLLTGVAYGVVIGGLAGYLWH